MKTNDYFAQDTVTNVAMKKVFLRSGAGNHEKPTVSFLWMQKIEVNRRPNPVAAIIAAKTGRSGSTNHRLVTVIDNFPLDVARKWFPITDEQVQQSCNSRVDIVDFSDKDVFPAEKIYGAAMAISLIQSPFKSPFNANQEPVCAPDGTAVMFTDPQDGEQKVYYDHKQLVEAPFQMVQSIYDYAERVLGSDSGTLLPYDPGTLAQIAKKATVAEAVPQQVEEDIRVFASESGY